MVVYGPEDLSWPCCQLWSSSSTCVCGRVLYETGSTAPTHGGRIRYLWAEFFVLLFPAYGAKEREGESRHYRATSASHTYATRQLRHLSIVFPPNFAAKIGVRPSRAPPFKRRPFLAELTERSSFEKILSLCSSLTPPSTIRSYFIGLLLNIIYNV